MYVRTNVPPANSQPINNWPLSFIYRVGKTVQLPKEQQKQPNQILCVQSAAKGWLVLAVPRVQIGESGFFEGVVVKYRGGIVYLNLKGGGWKVNIYGELNLQNGIRKSKQRLTISGRTNTNTHSKSTEEVHEVDNDKNIE